MREKCRDGYTEVLLSKTGKKSLQQLRSSLIAYGPVTKAHESATYVSSLPAARCSPKTVLGLADSPSPEFLFQWHSIFSGCAEATFYVQDLFNQWLQAINLLISFVRFRVSLSH